MFANIFVTKFNNFFLDPQLYIHRHNIFTTLIYSALFEGDTTRQLPKVISFTIRLFMFFNFLVFFILESLKKNKIDYSTKLGGNKCRGKAN